MNIKKWDEFIESKKAELELDEYNNLPVTKYATLWMLINLFRFLMDWYDEWKELQR